MHMLQSARQRPVQPSPVPRPLTGQEAHSNKDAAAEFVKTSFTPAELRTVKQGNPVFMTALNAEGHFYKMMSKQNKTNIKIKSIIVVQNSALQKAFERKKDEFNRSGIPSDPIYAYHGTKSEDITVDSILMNNFDMAYAKRQAHGPGHYFSEYPDVSLGYGPGLIFCQLLSGKEYKGPNKVWPGFNSKVGINFLMRCMFLLSAGGASSQHGPLRDGHHPVGRPDPASVSDQVGVRE